jgi:hypothetical protein
MTHSRHHEVVKSLGAAFVLDRAVSRLGRAVWLYLHLVVNANDWGLVISPRSRIAKNLGVTDERIDSWLTRLANAGLIKIETPSPYLVIRLRFWSRPRARGVEKSTPGSGRQAHVSNARVGSSKQQAAAASSKSSGDGGRGEGVSLEAEARAILGEDDVDDVRELIDAYPAYVVQKALHRVRMTPSEQIRKSKTALFRFLLGKFSE